MSWIEQLYRTYENNVSAIGDCTASFPLLPVCHTTQKAQVTIAIDSNGTFVRASVVAKEEARTIIPATEESAGRTSGTVSHPLCDKLQYVAADYKEYGGEKESGHDMYLSLLDKWTAADKENPKLKAVSEYVRRGHVVEDLVRAGVFFLQTTAEKDGKPRLLNQWTAKEETPAIFRLLGGGVDGKGKNKPWQADAFVRWVVEIPSVLESTVWKDHSLWKSWQDYYGGIERSHGLCQVTGIDTGLADQHPSKIRNDGDKAKLISSNDSSGFTFRGRFTSSNEACGVSFEVTQKAHNALRWLIGRQGATGMKTYVAWAVSGAEVPDPFADTLSLLSHGDIELQAQKTALTAQEIGIALSKLIAGYSTHLGSTEDVVIMGLDSATPGRMAITFYRELTGSEFLERVFAWHSNCFWRQYFGNDRTFFGAPAPRDIAEAAFGKRIDDRLRKVTVERLLPCIVDGVAIPRDLVGSCVGRATNRQGLEHWEWEKVLGIACAVYRQQNRERNYSMALERERTTRDYLYGRLLALAEHLEGRALYLAGEDRETNAARLMQRFADRPHSTWLTIEASLCPYKARLRSKRSAFLHSIETEIDEVFNVFLTNDFISDQKLSGEFLLGYHCQRSTLQARARDNGNTESIDASDKAAE